VRAALLGRCAALALVAACRDRDPPRGPVADVAVVALPQIERPPAPRKGMAWIPPGVFVAGTPPDRLPRAPDQELPGVQTAMHGFFIDLHPYPNEPGALQTTNVTLEEAKARCEQDGKRLCTELEWERACKGPASWVYEYGDTHRPDPCAGAPDRPCPSGTRPACHSAFGVFDLHGGAWEWTASLWGRGETRSLVAVRGGADPPGEVVGRCANASARRPDARGADLGFRCCAGEPNDAVVQLEVARPPDPAKAMVPCKQQAALLERSLADPTAPANVPKNLGPFIVDRVWQWFPVGNEQLLVGAGCARQGLRPPACGVVSARRDGESARALAFAPSGWYPANVQFDGDSRILWVYGVDDKGHWRRRVVYAWGRVVVGERAAGESVKPRRKRPAPR
jgi:hypothetical protein